MSFNKSWFRISKLVFNLVLPFRCLFLLGYEFDSSLLGVVLLLFSVSLLCEHRNKLVLSYLLLLFQLILIDSELGLHSKYLILRLLQFVETVIQMTLELNQLLLLKRLEMSKMLDEIKEVSWRDVIELLCLLLKLLVDVSDRLVKVNYALTEQLILRIDNLAIFIHDLVLSASDALCEAIIRDLNHFSQGFGHLEERVIGPVSKPIDNTSVEQSRRTSSSVGEIRILWVHREHYMQIPLNVVDEMFV